MRSGGCSTCGHVVDMGYCDWSPDNDYGPCRRNGCSGRLRFVPEGFVTDVFGSAIYSDAAGCEVTSSRERDRIMRNTHHVIGDTGYSVRGYEPAGDKVGGARADHSLKRTAFSGGGIRTRTSTGERALSRR